MTRAASEAAAARPAEAERAARSALAARPRGDAAARALLSLAGALAAQGRGEAARRALAEASPALADRELAAAARRSLRPPAPPPPDPVRRAPAGLRRGEALLAAGRPEEALAEIDSAAFPGAAARARAEALRALALQALGRGAEAEAFASRALAVARDDGTSAAAELVLARAAARDRRHREAIALYHRLARRRAPVPGLPPQKQRELPEDASFLAAWLPYDAGDFAGAARSLRRWLRDHPSGRRADDARWFEAWSIARTGNRDLALVALGRLVPGPLESRALYWQARLAEGTERKRRLYRQARAAAGPDSWYGQLAAARLRELGLRPAPWEIPAGAAPGDGPGPGAAGRSLARASALLAAGLPAAARDEMAALAAAPGARAAASRLAQLAQATGDLELPARLARDLLPLSLRALRLEHPRAGPGQLPLLAAAGADEHLLLALVRRESSFRGSARSSAGAVGLLQLLPGTGLRLAAAAGVPPDRADLSDPAVSLAAGALYLGLLADHFGHPAPALAAYNAGPAAAAAWARDLAGLPLDEWVEDLPFRETRRYVKSVLADAGLRRWLYGSGDLSIDGLATPPPPGEGVAF